MKKTVYNVGHWGADSPDGQPVMVAYWTTRLACTYANAAYLNWFGKPDTSDLGSLQLQQLLGGVFESFEPHIQAVLRGQTRTFEIEWASGNGVSKKAMARLVPDYSGDTVRGFIVTSIGLSSWNDGTRRDTNLQVMTDDRKVADALNKTLQQYAEELGTVLSEYWGDFAADEIKPLSVDFMLDDVQQIVVAQAGSSSFNTEINLYDCISNAVESLDNELKATKTSVRVRVSPFIYVHANAVYMESIICSFLGNALKRRSVDRSLIIELSSMVVGNETVLNIRDNGNGMDLGAFYGATGNREVAEADEPDKRLYTVRQQVYAMGGHIGVESDPDKGTWFRIYIKTKMAS